MCLLGAWLFLVRCPGPLGSCSLVCPLGVLCCVCGVRGHLAPVHWCARSVHFFASPVSWATWLLITGVPAWVVVLRLRCFGPLGSCSPVCPLGALLCCCGVLGHLAPVHRCAGSVCCVVCAVSWATWLLFTGVRCVACSVSWATSLLITGVPAPSVPVLVRCHGPLGSCSAVSSLRVFWCVCGVHGNLTPVHRCARSILCFARAASWASWLLFTGVPAWCVVLLVRCPGPLGSCSTVRLLCVLCRACGILGLLAPAHRCVRSVCCVACAVSWGPLALVHRCARSVCCVWCAVSWASWPLFTGVLARCGALWAACPGRRCGAHTRPSGWRLFVAGRGWVSCRAHTRPSGRRLFVAGRGWVPSGRALVHPDGGCSVAGRGWVCCRARTRPSRQRLVLLVTCSRAVAGCVLRALSGHPAAVAAWHLSVCLDCGRQRASLACLVAPPGALRLVRSGRSGCSGWLSRRCGAFPHPGGLRPRLYWVAGQGHTEAGREPGSLCLPLAPAEAGALGSLRVVHVWGPAMGLSLAGPSGVGLGLHALRWLACVDSVTDASGYPYQLPFHR